jgi:lysyl endopeptidase
MKFFFLFITSLFLFQSVSSQTRSLGGPEILKGTIQKTTEFHPLPALDSLVFNETNNSREKINQYGVPIPVDINILKDSKKDTLPNGTIIYQYGIVSNHAVSLNLIFNRFKLRSGSKLFIVSSSNENYVGAYTSLNNNQFNSLGTDIIFDSKIIIELSEPKENYNTSLLHIESIIHGVKNIHTLIKRNLNNSGICNIDVNCPQGNGFENQRNSVAIMINGSGGFCSGSLINTTSGPIKPYFLSAFHCGTNPTNWVFRFRWETPDSQTDCGTNVPSQDIPENFTINGAALIASNKSTDFILCELSHLPDKQWNAFFNGWDKSGSTPLSGTGIHHPYADIKKISLDYDTLVSEAFNPNEPSNHWRTSWKEGITEQGSSGSPLFDQNHRTIGQLHGGDSGCISDFQTDFYGKLSESWEGGNTPETRLKDWLDPANKNLETVNGAYLNDSIVVNYDPYIPFNGTNLRGRNTTKFLKPYLIISNAGVSTLQSLVISYSIDNVTPKQINWNGTLNQYELDTIFLPEQSFGEGFHTLQTNLILPTNATDYNLKNNSINTNFEQINDASKYIFNLQLDQYPSETRWIITNSKNEIVYEGGPYTNNRPFQKITENLSLKEDCFTLKLIDYNSNGIDDGILGSYNLIDKKNDTILQMLPTEAKFNSSISKKFCTIDPNHSNDNSLNIYPNPITNNKVEINSSIETILYVNIYDIAGQLLKQLQFNSTFIYIDTEQFAQGVYLFEVKTTNHTYLNHVIQY